MVWTISDSSKKADTCGQHSVRFVVLTVMNQVIRRPSSISVLTPPIVDLNGWLPHLHPRQTEPVPFLHHGKVLSNLVVHNLNGNTTGCRTDHCPVNA